jgi:hypothetical protein
VLVELGELLVRRAEEQEAAAPATRLPHALARLVELPAEAAADGLAVVPDHRFDVCHVLSPALKIKDDLTLRRVASIREIQPEGQVGKYGNSGVAV